MNICISGTLGCLAGFLINDGYDFNLCFVVTGKHYNKPTNRGQRRFIRLFIKEYLNVYYVVISCRKLVASSLLVE